METNIDSVCNWIKAKRETLNKSLMYKGITVKLFKENNRQVSAKLLINYNKNTGHISFTHGLHYLNKSYHPNINHNKLKCINEHTIKQYEKSLKYLHEKISKKTVNFKLFNDIHLLSRITYITYNSNTGHIHANDRIHYKKKYVKLGIK